MASVPHILSAGLVALCACSSESVATDALGSVQSASASSSKLVVTAPDVGSSPLIRFEARLDRPLPLTLGVAAYVPPQTGGCIHVEDGDVQTRLCDVTITPGQTTTIALGAVRRVYAPGVAGFYKLREMPSGRAAVVAPGPRTWTLQGYNTTAGYPLGITISKHSVEVPAGGIVDLDIAPPPSAVDSEVLLRRPRESARFPTPIGCLNTISIESTWESENLRDPRSGFTMRGYPKPDVRFVVTHNERTLRGSELFIHGVEQSLRAATVEFTLRRLEVDHVTLDDGTTQTGTYQLFRRSESGRYASLSPCKVVDAAYRGLTTQTGFDVLPGEYRVLTRFRHSVSGVEGQVETLVDLR